MSTITELRQPSLRELEFNPEDKISVFHQLREFRSQVPKNILRSWEEPTGFAAICTIARDWGVILTAWQIYLYQPNWLTFLFAIFLMSWGQRGIHNLAHDSIHRNLVSNKYLNDIIADIFLAPCFMTTASLQRHQHSAHHHYLGTAADPDHGLHNETSLRHYRTGRHDHTSIFSLFLYDVVDPVAFSLNALGSFTKAPLQLSIWWATVAVLMGFFEPKTFSIGFIPVGWQFLVLFHTTRCTLSYCFYILRETIDHSGLQPTTILAFSRNTPCCNMFQYFLQPHSDCYHLLHHLLPRIPMTKLHIAHEWLVDNCESYERANRYTTYFSGDHALFADIPKGETSGEDNDAKYTNKTFDDKQNDRWF